MPMMMETRGIIVGWDLGTMVVAADGRHRRMAGQTIHENRRGAVNPLTTAREQCARNNKPRGI